MSYNTTSPCSSDKWTYFQRVSGRGRLRNTLSYLSLTGVKGNRDNEYSAYYTAAVRYKDRMINRKIEQNTDDTVISYQGRSRVFRISHMQLEAEQRGFYL